MLSSWWSGTEKTSFKGEREKVRGKRGEGRVED